MKRKTVLLFLCLIVLLSATAGIVACKVEHKHAFTEQNVDEAYLASPATCTSSATYYYSCACGEKGTATFASGNALNHSFTNYVSDGNATCTADGTKTAKCDRDGCNATDTVADEGSVIPHADGAITYKMQYGSDAFSAKIEETVYCKLCTAVIATNDYNITLPTKTFSYDGQKHSLTFEGDALPERITPIFNGNDQTAAGDYTVTAGFVDNETQTVFTVVLESELKVNKDGKYHEVVFAFDDAEKDNISVAVKHGEKISEAQYPQLPEKKGYTVKWLYDDSEVTDDVTISILYTPIVYKINYVLDSAENNPRNPDTYTIESSTITLYEPQNAMGLSFQGWYSSPNYELSSRISTIASGSTGDLTFYAKFLKYKVEAADGFTFDYKSYDYPALTQTVSSTKSTILLSTTIQVSSGCTWTLSRDIEGADVIKTKNMSLTEGHNIAYITVWYGDDLNLVYYLDIYKLGHRNYSFVADGVTVFPQTTVEEQSYVSAPAAPEKPGYTFTGWYAYSSFTVGGKEFPISIPDRPAKFPYCLNKDTAFLAIFKPNVYTATYDVNGGKPLAYETENITFDKAFTPVEPQRDGYTFVGWQDSEGNVFKSLSQWKYLSSQTFTAQWQLNTYSIDYDLDGGTNPEEAVYEYTILSETITLLNPSKVGYDFSGWFADADFGEQVTEIVSGSFVDKKFYAKWTPVVYGITYVLNGGTNSDDNPTTYTIEDEDIVLANATKTGYTFGGWYADYNCTDDPVTTIKSGNIGDICLYAKFTANKYTITYQDVRYSGYSGFYYSSGSKYTQTVTFDASVTLLDFSRTGYAKTGWYNGEELLTDGIWHLAENVTLVADWKLVTYNISYQLGGGTNNADNPTGYTIETSTITLKSPTGEHTFTGWYKDITLTQKVTSIQKGSYGDITLYAGWQHTPSSDWIVDKQPTCTKTGLKHKICSACGGNCSYTTIAKDSGAHTPYEVVENKIEATCTKKGSYDKVTYCSECHKQLSRTKLYSKMIDHVWNSDGKCKNCGCDFVSQGLTYELNSNGNGYVLTGIGTCKDSTLVIPSSHNGLPVTSIDSSAFEYCSGLTSVIIGSGVTSIGSRAFDGCYKLVEVINNSSLSITKGSSSNGYVAYYSLNVKTGGSSEVVKQDGYLFYTYDNVNYLLGYNGTEKELVLPENYNGQQYQIYKYAFYNCNALISVTIGSGVTSIGSSAFRGCSGLTSVTIPDSVTSIENSAFSGCSGLESITLPFVGGSRKTSSDDYQYPFGYIFGTSSYTGGVGTKQYCYYYGSSSTGTKDVTYYIPSSLKSVTITGGNILYGAFYNCSGLTSVTIGSGVTSIGERAFRDCSGLTSVIWNAEDCTSAGSYYYPIFENCTNLTTVTIGDNVKTIPSSAFGGCTGLTSVTIPDSVTTIGNYAFGGCTGLTSVTIPDSVTTIGNYAFEGCSGLTSVTIGTGVTSIGERAFRDCSGLTSVIWNAENCISAGSSSYPIFNKCTNLTTVTIGDNVKTIQSCAFYGCSGLTSVTIGSGVTLIGSCAFSGCYKLVEVINNSSLSITKGSSDYGDVAYYALNVKKGGSSEVVNQDGYLFYTYNKVNYLLGHVGTETELTLPNNYHGQNYQIYKYAFKDCRGLTSITIGSGVTSIGYDAFSGCSGLTSVTIPDSVTSIGELAFNGCSGLKYNEYDNALYLGNNSNPYVVLVEAKTTKITSCNINETCKIIYYDAFSGCRGLTSIKIPDSVTTIGSSAFRDCSGLTSITIGSGVTSIGNGAFSGCYKLVEVINNSSLSITKGSSSNGYVAYYSLNVKTGGSSEVVKQDGYLFYTYDNVNYLLGYNGTEKELVLPENYNGQQYQIYKYAFYNCNALISVTIGSGITSIGKSAFV